MKGSEAPLSATIENTKQSYGHRVSVTHRYFMVNEPSSPLMAEVQFFYLHVPLQKTFVFDLHLKIVFPLNF